MPTQAYRLRIRPANDTGVEPDALVITSIRGGTNPYIAAVPNGDGQEVDLLTGAVRTGAYVVEVADVVMGTDSTGTIRLVTSNLYDGTEQFLLLENGDKILLENGDPIELEVNNAEFGRPHLLSRKAFLEMSADGGSTWSVWQAGYLTNVRQVDAIRYAFTISNTRRVEQTKQVFTWTSSQERLKFPQRGCVFGGPIIDGFGVGGDKTIDSRGWEFKFLGTSGSAAAPKQGDVLVFSYEYGYFEADWERKRIPGPKQARNFWNTMLPYRQVVPGDRALVGSLFNQLNDQDIVPAYPRLLAVIQNGADTFYGGIRCLFNTATGNPFQNSQVNIWPFDQRQKLFVTLDAYDPDDVTAPWPALPAVDTIVRVRAVARQVDETSPLYIDLHPVEIANRLYELINVPVDGQSVQDTIAAIGGNTRVAMRLTEPQTMAEFIESALFGPFGFAARTNASNEIEFFTTRQLEDSAPTLTIGDADIVGDAPPPIFDLDEGTVVTSFVVEQQEFSRFADVDGGTETPPPDGIRVTKQALQIDNADTSTFSTRVVEYRVPGMVHDVASFVPNLQDFIVGIAREGFDRFGRGAPSMEVQVLRTSAAAAAQIGDLVYLNAGYYPNKNYRIGESTVGPRVAQIVRRDEKPEGPMFKLVDAGVYNQPAIAPTITIAGSTADPRRIAEFIITNAAALNNAADLSVAIEWATGASAPAAGEHGVTFTRYAALNIPTGAVALPPVTPGTTVYVRARTEQAGLFPSLWTNWQSVTLSAWSAPSSVTVSSITNGSALVSWSLGGNTTDTVDVFVAPGSVAPSSWQGYRINSLSAGTTSITLTNLGASANYIVGVAFRDIVADTRGTVATATFSTTGTTSGTAPRPAGFAIIQGVANANLPQGVALALWSAAGADQIVIERAPNSAGLPGAYTAIATVSAETETYIDYLPRDGTTYWYRIKHTRSGQTDSGYMPEFEVGFVTYYGLSAVATGVPNTLIRPEPNAAQLTPFTLADNQFTPSLNIGIEYDDPQNRISYYEYRTRTRTSTSWGAWSAYSKIEKAGYSLIRTGAFSVIESQPSVKTVRQMEWRVYGADTFGTIGYIGSGVSEYPQNYGTNAPIITQTRAYFDPSNQKYTVFWRYYFQLGNNQLDEDGTLNKKQTFTTEVVAASVRDQNGNLATNVVTSGVKNGTYGWTATWDSTPTQQWTYEVRVNASNPSTYQLQFQETNKLDEEFIAVTQGQTFTGPSKAADANYIYAGDYGVEDNPSNTNATYVTGQTAKLQAVLDIAAQQRRILYCGGLRIKVNGPLYMTGPGLLFDATRNDDGPGLYVLTNGSAGTGYTVLTTCASYGPVVKGSIINEFNCKIQADGSLGGRATVNGVKFFNPQLSTIQNVRASKLNGTGVEIDEVFDSVFTTISVEECGNSSSYAMKCAATSGTSNETHIQRLQVELSVERAIYVDMLASIIDNIHSERADVDLTPSDPSWAYTWVISGARCHFNQGRFDASIGSQNGRLLVEGENCVYTAFMTEPSVEVDMDGFINSGIVMVTPCITNIGRIKSGDNGRVQILGGQLTTINAAVNPGTKAPVLLTQGATITTLTIGDCGNPAYPEQIVFTECEIDTLQASSTLAAATFRGCTIGNWVTNNTQYGYCFVVENDCRITTSGTIKVDGGLIIRDSRITGNVEMGGGATIIANNLMVVGNLTQLGSPPTHSSIFDGACCVTGTVTGLSAAPGDGPSVTVAQPSNYWLRNQRHYNLVPANGDPTVWICRVAGDPGTWETENTLSANGVLLLE